MANAPTRKIQATANTRAIDDEYAPLIAKKRREQMARFGENCTTVPPKVFNKLDRQSVKDLDRLDTV